MRLLDPRGVVVQTSDELGEKLLKKGYTLVPPPVEEGAPAPKPATRRKSPKQ